MICRQISENLMLCSVSLVTVEPESDPETAAAFNLSKRQSELSESENY